MTTKNRASDEAAPASSDSSSPDVALIHGVTPDGGLQILRARGDRLELGAIRPLKEGVAITGEVVKLHPREHFPALCDVEVQLAAPELPRDRQVRELTPAPAAAANALRSGPAQVATDQYRKNWDTIWSRPGAKEKLAN